MNTQPNGNTTPLGAQDPTNGAPRPPRTVADLISRAEFWLNKVGIILFLFGVVFFFKYALDHEWISELQRVIIGTLFGSALLGWGLAIRHKMRHFSHVLMGGGIATYYITAFSSYVLFTSLKVPYELAFGAMASITALAFLLAIWTDDVTFALVGVLGGLATPFALGFTNVGTSPLMIYTRLLILVVGAIFLFRGWRSLLWTTAFGVMPIFILAAILRYSAGFNSVMDVQLTILSALATFWVVPVAHELLSWSRPNLFRSPSVPRLSDPSLRHVLNWHAYIMPLLAPFLALAFSANAWGDRVPQPIWGIVTLILAAGTGAAAYFLRSLHTPLAILHRWLSIALATLGTTIFSAAFWDYQGSLLFLTLALQATIMHVIAARTHDRWLGYLAHTLYTITGLWLFSRLISPIWTQDTPFLTAPALVDLVVIGLFFATSLLLRKLETRILYQLVSCASALGWLFRETANMPLDLRINYTMLALTMYGALLLFTTRTSARTQSTPTELNEWGQALGHILYVVSGAWVLGRIVYGLIMVNTQTIPIFNPRGLTDLATILLVAFAAFLLRHDPDRRPLLAYGLGLHIGILGWSWQEIGLYDQGNGYVTIAWGAYAIALLISAFYFMRRANDGQPMKDGHTTSGGWKALLTTPRMVTLAMGVSTLFIVAGKLFLVDLRYLAGEANAPWRILLFLGFGALFLGISYAFASMTRKAER